MNLGLFNIVGIITGDCIVMRVCLALLSIILMLLLILVRKFDTNSCDNSEAFNDVGSVT
jgi:hypothetical protein